MADASLLLANVRLLHRGPVIGWTRPGPDGALRVRVWGRPDEMDSEPPLGVLTCVCERATGRVVPGSARIWALLRLVPRIEDDAEEAPRPRPPSIRVAIADVGFPVSGDYVIRMLGLHRHYAARPDPAQSAAGERASGIAREDEFRRERITIDLGDERLATGLLQSLEADPPGGFAGWNLLRTIPAPGDAGPLQPLPLPVAVGVSLDPAWIDERAQGACDRIARMLAGERDLRNEPRLGTLSRKQLAPATDREWEAAPAATVVALARSAADRPQDSGLCFAAACCRYPGTRFERELADRSLVALAQSAAASEGPAFALFTGDQIYADATAGVFDVESRFERFSSRYEQAFGSIGFRRLATSLPVYMVADDHEIEDGWSRSRLAAAGLDAATRRARRRVAAWAHASWLAWQRHHGPDSPIALGEADDGGAHGWYAFEQAGVRFLVMDTRFEREADRAGGRFVLIGDAQRGFVSRWLEKQAADEHAGRIPEASPRFIVSGSVFAPGLAGHADLAGMPGGADGWAGFPADRAWLAREIARLQLRNVVFLSGDYHCAAASALRFGGTPELGPPIEAWAIVAPPLYAPYPFANTRASELLADETIPWTTAGATIGDAGADSGAAPENVAPVGCVVATTAVDGCGFASIRVRRTSAPVAADAWAIDVSFHAVSADVTSSRPPPAPGLHAGPLDATDAASPVPLRLRLTGGRVIHL